jgi:alpha-galactosidase
VSVKISLIGAGSAAFSLALVRDICLTPSLRGSTVSFMDVNPGRLDAVHRLCSRYAAEAGIRLNIEKTTDRRKSLAGADFVINTALAAGHDRLRAGWKVARPLGYRFGGSRHIIHDESFWINFYQLRLMESLLKDILEICPKAWFLLVANPVMAGVTYLTRKYPQAKMVGLCHGYGGIHELIGKLGLDAKDVSFEIPGVNHFIWLTKLTHKGRDAFPLIDRWIREKAPAFHRRCGMSSGIGPKAVDLFKRFGAFPIGDTCTPGGGSWPYWYHTSDAVEKRWKEDPAGWYAGYFKWGARGVAELDRISRDSAARVTDKYPPKKSGETMIPLIESLAGGKPGKYILNIPNKGSLVPGIPEDYQVEVWARTGRKGIEGIKSAGLPKPLVMYTLRDMVAPVETELEAFRTGRRDLLLNLVLMDPFTKSYAQAEKLLAGILRLPFNKDMRAHYR